MTAPGRPCVARHPDPRAGVGPWHPGRGWCRLCWLALNTAEYGPAWAGRTPAEPQPIPGRPAPVPLPCVNEGHACAPPPGAVAGRSYLRCDAGMGDPPGVVCRCHCNPGCRLYEAD